MIKKIKSILFSIYFVIAVVITLLLLGYNDFKVTQFGNYTLLIVKDNELAPEFNEGDLLILNKTDDIFTGRKAFFYDSYQQKIEIRLGMVEEIEKVTDTEKTYTFEGEKKVSSDYVIGPANFAEVIPHLGKVLEILESKWGFLFLIVFPALVASVNQIGVVFNNIIDAKKEEAAEAKAKKENKENKE